MKSNKRIIGAVLASVGTWLIARHLCNIAQQNHKLATKKSAKHAVHSWEGEGGNIVDPAPRPAGG